MARTQQHDELEQLLLELTEGQLTGEGHQRLSQLLEHDAAARERYLAHLHLHGLLQWRLNAVPSAVQTAPEKSPAPPAHPWPPSPPPSRWQRAAVFLNQPLVFSSIFAAALLFAAITLMGVIRIDGEAAPGDEGSAPAHAAPLPVVARITGLSDARWEPGQAALAEGSALRARQVLHLAAGVVRVRFSHGAEVLLEGPAIFTADRATGGSLLYGALTARVPPAAQGFSVATPQGTAIDLGTEFGVRVDDQGQAEIHVFNGFVRFEPREGGEPRKVGGNEAIRITAGTAAPLRADRTAFVHQLPQSSPLLGFYPFEGDARDAGPRGRHAALVSEMSFVAGYEGQAARFAGSRESFVDLPIDASATALPRLTWGAWVRPTAIAAEANQEIFSTGNGGYDRALTIDHRGAPRPTWALFTGSGVHHSSAPLAEANQWRFVAAVYDQAAQTATLYVEDPALNAGKGGLVVDRVDHANIGASRRFVRVGNHTGRYREPFAGEIDNVFLFADALTAEQLEQIRREGQAGIFKLAQPNGSSTESQGSP